MVIFYFCNLSLQIKTLLFYQKLLTCIFSQTKHSMDVLEDLPTASYTTLEEKETRHAQLLADLQYKYKGKAGKGRYYPPGTCPTGLLMQLLNSGATSVKKHQSAIEAMEEELPCVPRMVKPPLANNSHSLESHLLLRFMAMKVIYF